MPMPDAQIHPHATGKALEIVKTHEKAQDLIFYSGWFCPFNQRVWVALEEKGIDYQYHEINPYHKEKEFLAINPKGLVPAVKHHGVALYESMVLLEYLEEEFPDTKHLFPETPKERALARIQCDYIAKKILPTYFKLIQMQDQKVQDEARGELVDSLKEVADKVKGPFFSGNEFGVVDLAIAPFFMRFYIIEEHRGFRSSHVGDKFTAWFKACTSRQSMIETTSDKEHYEEIYGRYLANEAQSEMGKSTRGEKSHV
ncbi:glutathione-S-transferase [Meredithblackwellia eburnea MCA 4105]